MADEKLTPEEAIYENLRLTREMHGWSKETRDFGKTTVDSLLLVTTILTDMKKLLSDALEPGDNSLGKDIEEIKEGVNTVKGRVPEHFTETVKLAILEADAVVPGADVRFNG